MHYCSVSHLTFYAFALPMKSRSSEICVEIYKNLKKQAVEKRTAGLNVIQSVRNVNKMCLRVMLIK